MTSTLPATDEDGEPLVYHRLTGLAAALAPNVPSQQDVLHLCDTGGVLAPYHDRVELDPNAEPFGIDPIDIVAGDGDFIFMTPLRPFARAWAKGRGSAQRAPGVAFRLRDLLVEHAKLRPTDLQTAYMGLKNALDLPRFDFDSFDAEVDTLSPLADACGLVQAACELRGAQLRSAVAALLRGDDLAAFARNARDVVSNASADRAADMAVELAVNSGVCDYEDEDGCNVLKGAFVGEFWTQAQEASDAWSAPSVDSTCEFLHPGSVSLDLAVLVFDQRGFTWRRRGKQLSLFGGTA